jgi:hypothetical protein
MNDFTVRSRTVGSTKGVILHPTNLAGYAFGSTRSMNCVPKRVGAEATLQKFDEFLHGQAGLPNDRAQSAGFQVSPGMNPGRRPPPISGGHRYLTNFGMGIGRWCHSLFPPILEDCTDGLLGIGKRFLFGLALGHDLRQGRHKHRKAPRLPAARE